MILFSTDLQYQSFRLHIPCQSSWQRQRHQHLQLTFKEIPIFEITVQSIWTFPEVSVPKTTTVRPLWRVVLHLQRQPHVSRTLFIHGCWLRDRLWQQLLFILLFQVSYSLFSNNNETIISLSRLLFNVRYLFYQETSWARLFAAAKPDMMIIIILVFPHFMHSFPWNEMMISMQVTKNIPL